MQGGVHGISEFLNVGLEVLICIVLFNDLASKPNGIPGGMKSIE